MNLFQVLLLPTEIVESILAWGRLSPTACPICQQWHPTETCSYCNQPACTKCLKHCYSCLDSCVICLPCHLNLDLCKERLKLFPRESICSKETFDYCYPDCTHKQKCGNLMAWCCIGCNDTFCCEHCLPFFNYHEKPIFYCMTCAEEIRQDIVKKQNKSV